jgi:iron(II)-dependent oxidoreductase
MPLAHSRYSPAVLRAKLQDARARLKRLCASLAPDQWIGPYRCTLNPPLWEFGHVAWFQEHWCLRLKPGVDPCASALLSPLLQARRPWADWLYNSSIIPHAARWRAPLPSVAETMEYAEQVLTDVCGKLDSGRYDDEFPYYVELSAYHELMHLEAWWMMWQACGYAAPTPCSLARLVPSAPIRFEGGPVVLGSPHNCGFVFDNEKWAHEIDIAAFEIDTSVVTCAAYAEFIADRGYVRADLWSAEGRKWLAETHASQPCYWRKADGTWQIRRFDRWVDLPVDEALMHVTRFEAEAYCNWRGRSLPTAAQWLRASSDPRFKLGGCWEWTADTFEPYTEFTADPYADYSRPWFHTHAEVRGAGSWVTDPALARPTYRNFYTSERQDPFIGFRTARSLG